MLDREERIQILTELGEKLSEGGEAFDQIARKAYLNNKWFTEENVRLAIRSIYESYLNPGKLRKWLAKYPEKPSHSPKTVGLIMAGNIPLVGFHDFLSVFASGHRALIKLSDKDGVLFPYVFSLMESIEPKARDHFNVVDQLRDFDAIIATGSNNSARYFEYYFGKYPHIIRKNRTSVAVLTGDETEEALSGLGKDIFRYFGLGCRNVSKLYVPTGYDFTGMLEKFQVYQDLILHNKYKNNYDYNLTLLILNKIPYLSNSCLLLLENPSLHSRIASLHYEYYDEFPELDRDLQKHQDEIQCLVGDIPDGNQKVVGFGETQQPGLTDYADNIDTMEFLTNL